MVNRVAQVAVVIPNFNGGDLLLETLDAVRKSDYRPQSVVVVDDCSPHDSALPRIKADYPDVTLLENSTNAGFAASANAGIAEALRRGAEYVLLLNNDAIVSPPSIRLLLDAMVDDEAIAAVMPLVYFYTEPDLIQSAGLSVDRNTGRLTHIGWRQRDCGQFPALEDRDSLHGCVMMISRRAWQDVGPLWEPYFAYYEEVDWCHRARNRGYRTCVAPQAQVLHHGGYSFGHESARYTHLLLRNRLLFVRRNHRGWQLPPHLTALAVDYLLTLAVHVRRRRWEHAAAIVRAVNDGVRGSGGPG